CVRLDVFSLRGPLRLHDNRGHLYQLKRRPLLLKSLGEIQDLIHTQSSHTHTHTHTHTLLFFRHSAGYNRDDYSFTRATALQESLQLLKLCSATQASPQINP